MDDLTGFVLAGGRSSRMGADKAFLDWHGRPLLHHAVELARRVAADVRIVAPHGRVAGYDAAVIDDVFPDHGPLGGIHAALISSATELNLILAVDMPFVVPEFLEYLAVQAVESKALVTVPRVAGGWQPLCAIYRRSFGAIAERALHAGRNKIDALFATVQLRIVDENELAQLAFDAAMLDNLNTREEFQKARARQVQNR